MCRNGASTVVVQSLRRVRLSVTPWTGSTPGSPVLRRLPEFAQTPVHGVDGAFVVMLDTELCLLRFQIRPHPRPQPTSGWRTPPSTVTEAWP